MTYRNYYETVERLKVSFNKWLNIVIGILFVVYFVFLVFMPFYLHNNSVECKGELQSRELRKSFGAFRYVGHQDYYYINEAQEIILESNSYWFFRTLSIFTMYNNMKHIKPVKSDEPTSITERFYEEYLPKAETPQQGGTFYYYITKSAEQNIQNPGGSLSVTPIFVSATNDKVGSLGYWVSLVGWTFNSWIIRIGYYFILFITIFLGTPQYIKVHKIYYWLLAGLFPLLFFI